jgi:hypothetical protein
MRQPEKNCGRIVERFCGPLFGRERIVGGRIVEELRKNCGKAEEEL